jgi:RNA polymerase sigma-70 factor (ECF subfamily)
LAKDAQIALTLRGVAGLTTEEIARAFVLPEATLAKRIARAKHKIMASGIAYRVPGVDELRSRLDEVLTVIYLVFNEGYLVTAGEAPIRRDLARDAEWLASLLANLLPNEPEPHGLLALIRLHLARWPARLNARGEFVLLQDQDRSLWDRRQIADALRLLERAARHGRPGPFQIEAAIAGVHCQAPTWSATNWQQLLEFYSLLTELDPSPVVALNRAIAVRYVHGPAQALEEVDRLAEALERYHLFHATRAALLNDLGREADAKVAEARALELTHNPAERALLAQRLAG